LDLQSRKEYFRDFPIMASGDVLIAPHHHQNNPHKSEIAIEFAQQAERLGQYAPNQENESTGSTQAVEAKFITAQDPVIETANGGRLPAVPIEEATKLNKLRDELDDRDPSRNDPIKEAPVREALDGTIHGVRPTEELSKQNGETDAPLYKQRPPSRTNPLFPPLPLYGPPTLLRRVQIWTFIVSSAILSFLFLLVIILGAAFTSIPLAARHIWLRMNFVNPDSTRLFYHEELKRRKEREIAEKEWERKQSASEDHSSEYGKSKATQGKEEEFMPLEGGPDPIICDPRYYARRVGLECETFDVQTEDGFIIELWHLYNPLDAHRTPSSKRKPHSPNIFPDNATEASTKYLDGQKKYPVLLIHGLLQSAGAYCVNDDSSLAFYLAKAGYDVWLGNNRCGFKPRHSMLSYTDPRMWAWNIRAMGVMDLPALISRVLSETGFEKLGLIAHSQGTTQTLVALAKEQRPEIGDKISVFCGLAPAAYAGPLIGKMYFKFMRVINPLMFRLIFGIHAFIPFMMTMHKILPGRFYGAMGYRVFSFLFNWTDERWELDLRDRMFQFAPVYVSAESMRWWLGRECFAKQKCILATRDEKIIEDKEDEREDRERQFERDEEDTSEFEDEEEGVEEEDTAEEQKQEERENKAGDTSNGVPKSPTAKVKTSRSDRSRFSWYPPGTPPFALWICGSDDLVDGRRLLRRFERNREPNVDLIHSKIIEGYEHLDVIWAIDVIDQVGKEVKEVLWKTAPEGARRVCRVPKGCEDVEDFYERKAENGGKVRTGVGASKGEGSERGKREVRRGGRDFEGEEKLAEI